MNTYCSGLTFYVEKNITKKDFIELMEHLKDEFNNYYKTDEYSFSPEKITEGGIIFDNFNHRKKYKTMRLYFVDSGKYNLYGFINDNVKNEWKNNDEILIKNNSYLGSFLKSSGYAPPWANNELKIFVKCLNKIGIKIHKNPLDRYKWMRENEDYLKLFNL